MLLFVSSRSLCVYQLSDIESDEPLSQRPAEHVVVLPIDESFRLSESQVVQNGDCYRDSGSESITAPFIIYIPAATRRVVYMTVDVVVDQSDGSDIESQVRAALFCLLQRYVVIIHGQSKEKHVVKRKPTHRDSAPRRCQSRIIDMCDRVAPIDRAPYVVSRKRRPMHRQPISSLGSNVFL